MSTEGQTPNETSYATEALKISFCAGFLLSMTACYSFSFSRGTDRGLFFPVSYFRET